MSQNDAEQERQDLPQDDDGAGQEPLNDELEAAKAKADDHWAQYLRAAAELDNTRKRAQRDIENAHRYALERFIGDLAPVRDSLEMGLAASGGDQAAEALRAGMLLTLQQLDQVLARYGVEVVDPAGQPFDPERHEAMQVQPSDEAAPDTVLTVIQKGLVLNGRLLRPARVVVARAP